MIIDNRERFSICVPTKTGCTSLTKMLVGRSQAIASHEGQFHTYEGGVGRRILISRHPITRWCSIYRHHSKEYSTFGEAAASNGPDAFARAFFRCIDERKDDKYAKFIWTKPIVWYAMQFKPDVVVDATVDGGIFLVDWLNQQFGLGLDEMPHLRQGLNKTADWELLDKLSDSMLERVVAWATQDEQLRPINVPTGYEILHA